MATPGVNDKLFPYNETPATRDVLLCPVMSSNAIYKINGNLK